MKTKVESITTTFTCERALMMMRNGNAVMSNDYDSRWLFKFVNGVLVRYVDEPMYIPKPTDITNKEINANWYII